MNQSIIRGLPTETETALRELMQEVGLSAVNLRFEAGDVFQLERDGDCVRVLYTRRCQLGRAVSLLPGFLESGETVLTQKAGANMLCYMADMSRNAVFNISSAKQMLRDLAKMGYDSMMLYTEDTYRLPDYPYFGHMRGAFTEEELRTLDDYADALGIELIPCVQALAHLATALQWPGLKECSDTNDILLVGEEKTYQFIRDVFAFCRRNFRSCRINIGMDEAHMLGRGRYLDRNGYLPKPEIMLRHLERVTQLAEEAQLWPMMWSDMFFRMAFDGKYYIRSGTVPQDVIDRVPERLSLIYWDYYSLDRDLFSHMVDCHQQFSNPVVFAGGAWKWAGFAPHNRWSLLSSAMQLEVCQEKQLKDIIVTGWGDDGGEASQFSVLPTLLYFAETLYTGSVEPESLETRSQACFGIGFEELLTLDAPNEMPGVTPQLGRHINPSRYLLYNDPLEGLTDRHTVPEKDPAAFAANAKRLSALAGHPRFGELFETLACLCLVLERKCDLGVRIRHAYQAKDTDTLRKIAQTEIPDIIRLLDRFIDVYRKQWYHENKTFGFSAQEQRLGGLRLRLESTSRRLTDWLDGRWVRIEELEQPVLSYNGAVYQEGELPYICLQSWRRTVAPGLL